MTAPQHYTPAEFLDLARARLLRLLGSTYPDVRADEIQLRVTHCGRSDGGPQRCALKVYFRDVLDVEFTRTGWEADILISALVLKKSFYGSARDIAKTIALAVAYSGNPE